MKRLKIKQLATFAFAASLVWACKDNNTPAEDPDDLTYIPYQPKAYTIKKPDHFPAVPVPADNPMTFDGVQLGRRLFYDPILSGNKTMSCSTCHLPEKNFTDGKAVSTGIDGLTGRRSAMPLLNIAYSDYEPTSPADTFKLFWDGRSKSLEDQALRPVQDPIEMHNTWANAVADLKADANYPTLFRKAFGISSKKEITKELAAKAIAQFERILISSGNSVYDQYLVTGDANVFSDEELTGKLMFNDEGDALGLPPAECFHCHGSYTLAVGRGFFNNGLDDINTISDLGLGEITGKPLDRGKFRAPSLRNVVFTAPYMHDGRFQTLEQVIDQYFHHTKLADNQIPFMATLHYNSDKFKPEHHAAILAFLQTLTDTTFINNPDIQSPF